MSDDKAALAAKSAMSVLAGVSPTPKESLALVKALHQDRQFGLARRMLEKQLTRDAFRRALDADPKRKLLVAQKRALSTYKDPDLQDDQKYARALEILQAADPLDATVDQETLGQAGAIYKRLWEHSGRERLLETSLAFYQRGYERGVERDFGYTGINAAFILDLLADLESPDLQRTAARSQAGQQRRARAIEIRQAIVRSLSTWTQNEENAWRNTTWWYLVTVGEAWFGLRDFEAAEVWLLKATALINVPDWERESTARQLATLWRLQQRERAAEGLPQDRHGAEVLNKFLGDAKPALDSVIRGKVGLALSGGGFRASLYHIGVLAKLAELDLLRHVECLSCVSGGSIIGAHYYLEVRKLLQSKADKDITPQDYIEIVARVCDDFFAGVERNIRTRIAAEWLTNLRMIFQPNYSRTMRAGDLYEREIFSRVDDNAGDRPRWLNELLIQPPDGPEPFRPKDHNWRRAAKAPILVLNATTLNTGHNWQFTATWMGEPPAGIDSEVDANYRLRRMYYGEAPAPYKQMRLGHAVAASACVPGLFEPLALPELYEHLPQDGDHKVRPVVRLVDGGVHDNQGTAALLEQGCSVLLVSDASGQMCDQDNPSSSLLGVPLRSNSILQARVRVSQFEDLDSRRRGGTLKGLMFVHLKKGLDTRPVDWVETRDRSDPPNDDPLLGYGVQRDIQHRLAAIRTDLDSFSEAEAYSLMASGYLMTGKSLSQPILGFLLPESEPFQWKFMQVEPLLGDPDSKSWLRQQLKVADKLALKVWLVTRRLQLAIGFLGVLLLSFAGLKVYHSRHMLREVWNQPLFVFDPTVGNVAGAVAIILLSTFGLGWVAKLVNYRKTLQQVLIGIGMATVGFLLARLHLHIFDRIFLWQGRLVRAPYRPTVPVMKDRSNRTYTLNPDDLGRAIEVLKRAAESFGLTRRERIQYQALIISGDLGIIGLIWVLMSSIVLNSVSPTIADWLVGLGGTILIVSGVGGMVSLVFNVPLFRKTRHERAELEKLGLTSLSKSLWVAGRKHRWLQRVRGALLLFFGSVYALLSAFIGPFVVFFSKEFFGIYTVSTVVWIAVFYALLGLTMLAARYFRNRREQIELVENAEKLEESLCELRRRAGDRMAIKIPAETLEQVARIESSQIAQERKTAILESAGSAQSGYAIRFAPEAAEQKSALDKEHRIKLEDLVEQLSTGLSHGQGDIPGREEINRVTIKSDPVELEYATDEPGRQIRIVAVRKIGVEAKRTPDPEEQKHA